MSLINCPECGHSVSNEAVSCPNCGRPLANEIQVRQPEIIVTDLPREESFPKWIIAPIIIIGAIVVFLVIVMIRNSQETANTINANVNVALQRKPGETKDTSNRTGNPPNQIEVGSNSTTVNPPLTTPVSQNVPTSSTIIPQNVPPSSQIDGSPIPIEKGWIVIDAKVSTKNGIIQSIKNEKFYLLDKDLESILRETELEPIEGQSLTNSFGLSVLYPDKYGDFRRDALNAINKHIKYNAMTDSGGKASMKNVEPNDYYLFGITKIRTGFAIWSSAVSIIGGENKLNLSPASLNELSE